jgi:BirA family biotin operon repressor/biotin-[acetyl-CoA-carboxylase] ligase
MNSLRQSTLSWPDNAGLSGEKPLIGPEESPLGAPVWYRDRVSSTMDLARIFAAEGAPHGAVVWAGWQDAGRGRGRERSWGGDAGKNLFCTVIFHYSGVAPHSGGAMPEAFTLRVGLAVSLAIEEYAPLLAGRVRVKWPNDIMLLLPGRGAGKCAGILTESDGKAVYLGMGINVAQEDFPPDLRSKATSILLARRALEPEADAAPDLKRLLFHILGRLRVEFDPGAPDGDWRPRLEERLYLRGMPVRFFAGAADRGRTIRGTLAGIGRGGELLLVPQGAREPEAFITGELDVYGGENAETL